LPRKEPIFVPAVRDHDRHFVGTNEICELHARAQQGGSNTTLTRLIIHVHGINHDGPGGAKNPVIDNGHRREPDSYPTPECDYEAVVRT
jgi:hypothetical protein